MTDFYDYLVSHDLAEGTSRGYVSSINSTVRRMRELGVVGQSFDEMKPSDCRREFPKILADPQFKDWDVAGHCVRSNGMRWYLRFLDDTNR